MQLRYDDLQAAYKTVDEEYSISKAKVQDYEASLNKTELALKQSQEESKTANKETARLKDLVAEKDKALGSFAKKVEDLNVALKKKENSEKKVASIDTDKYEKEKAALLLQLNNQTLTVEKLQKQLQDVEKSMASSKEEVANARTEIKTVQNALKNAEKEFELKRNEIVELEKERKEYLAKFSELEKENGSLKLRISALEEENKRTIKQNADSRKMLEIEAEKQKKILEEKISQNNKEILSLTEKLKQSENKESDKVTAAKTTKELAEKIK